MRLRIENTYTDGWESSEVHEVDEPTPAELDGGWWDEVAYELTGDGHGADRPGLGSCYTATIIEAENPALVGRSNEWLD